MLTISKVSKSFPGVKALSDVHLEVRAGEVHALVGENGAGKSTTLRTISGLIKPKSGEILFNGKRIDGVPGHEIVGMGICHSPEGRRIFPRMTVKENLELGAFLRNDKAAVNADMDRVLELFPRLKERIKQTAGTMSGGEQQMLAIARAMIAKPKVILLDEPSEGIMPVLVEEMFELFAKLKQQGLTILLVEQNVQQALKISDRAYILDQGEIVFHDTAQNLLNNDEIQQKYCAV